MKTKRERLDDTLPKPSLLRAWFRVHTLSQYEALRVRALERAVEQGRKDDTATQPAFQELESCCRNLEAGQF